MHFRNSWTRSMSSCCIRHVPSGASGGRGLKRLDLFLNPKIPGNIRDQVLDRRERLHRLHRHRPIERQIAHSCHAHQFGHPVDLGRTRAALAGFAIPSTGEVVRLCRLDVIDRIEHDHALRNARCVIAKLTAVRVAAPDFEDDLFLRGHLISPMIFAASSRAQARDLTDEG